MNYIAQLKGFRKARLIKPLSANSICLYFILLEYVNEINFLPWFTAANSTLTGLSRLSDSALKRARNELMQKGFIQYRKGVGSQSGSYHIVDLCANFDPQTDLQSDRQMGYKLTDNVDTLYKLNKTKRNKNNIPPKSPKGGEGENESSKSKNKKIYPSIEGQIVSYTDSGDLQNALEQFVDARKKMKKVLTEYAFYCLLRDLDRLAEKGYDKLKCVNMAVSRGWQGFYEPYKQKPIAKQEQKGGFIDTLNGILKEEGEL